MKIGIVYNKSKNRHIIDKFISELRQHKNINIIFKQTDTFAEGITQTENLVQSHCDMLVPVGGDGTVLSVINGLMRKNHIEIPIAILPVGTANDFAHELNIFNYRDTIQAILKHQKKNIDLIKCTYVDAKNQKQLLYANSSAGVGLLSSVFALQGYTAYRFLKKCLGGFAYALISFAKLAFAKSYPAIININDYAINADIQMLLVRKTKITGPVSLVPFARPDSGMLDTVLFHQTSLLNRFKIAIQMLFTKQKIENNDIDYYGDNSQDNKQKLIYPKKISIHTHNRMPLDLNGEFIGYTPCQFEIMPNGITMLSGAK